VLGSPDNLSVADFLASTASSPTTYATGFTPVVERRRFGEDGVELGSAIRFIRKTSAPCGALRGSAVSPRWAPTSLRASHVLEVGRRNIRNSLRSG
jgi:hypothetical protein